MSTVGLWKHPDNGRWYLTWTKNGRSHRATTGETDRGKAERVRANFVLERDRPKEARPDEVSIVTLLDSYYERHAKRLPSWEQARISIAHLAAFHGNDSVSSLTARRHEQYRDHCLAEGLSPGSINQRRNRLRAALHLAMKSGELTAAPHVPKEEEPPPRAEILTRAQVAAILRSARKHNYPFVALFTRIAVYTGARRTAILQLTWDRVDLQTGVVDFRLPGVVHRRKRRAATAVPPRLLATLKHLAPKAASKHVIEHLGKPIESIRYPFETVCRRAGMPWARPHMLKHTAVTWGLRVASPWTVSGMTATSLKTLEQVYGKHLVEDQREAAAAIAHNRGMRKPGANGIVGRRQ